MRLKFATFLLAAGTVVGCASNPPPPPPMAMAPPPPPPPAPIMSGDGIYRGMAMLTDDSKRGCRRMAATQSVRVRNGSFVLGGLSAKIGPDGTITSTARRGTTLSGTATNGMLDVTTMRAGCGYHYTLNHV